MSLRIKKTKKLSKPEESFLVGFSSVPSDSNLDYGSGVIPNAQRLVDTDNFNLEEILLELKTFSSKDESRDLSFIIEKIAENKNYDSRFRDFINKIYDSDNFNKINDIKECVYDFYIEKNKSNEKNAFNFVIDKFSKKYSLFYKKAQYAENSPVYVAEQMSSIIKIMLQRIKPESRLKSLNSIRDKIKEVNIPELAGKKSPGGAAIGVTLSLIKNILMARDQFFIDAVIKELILRL